MYFYTKEIEGMTVLYSGTKLPKNMDGVVLITEEEYRQEQKRLEEIAAEIEAEVPSEQDYLDALAVLGVTE